MCRFWASVHADDLGAPRVLEPPVVVHDDDPVVAVLDGRPAGRRGSGDVAGRGEEQGKGEDGCRHPHERPPGGRFDCARMVGTAFCRATPTPSSPADAVSSRHARTEHTHSRPDWACSPRSRCWSPSPAAPPRVSRPLRPAAAFPPELVDWVPYDGKPALRRHRPGHLGPRDPRARVHPPRGRHDWRLWYTGYDSTRSETKSLGYATSPDGLAWTRHPKNPVFDGVWTEDVFVLKHEGLFHMFAEGVGDVAHRLTSPDGVRWEEQGRLDVRRRSGEPISAGAYGTPDGLGRGRDLLPLLRARRQGGLAGHLEGPAACGRTCGTSR